MKPVVQKSRSVAIVYDASCMDLPSAESFTADYWAARNALQGEAIGRGSAWFIDAPFGSVVLRRYLRGGWVAKFSRERYFFATLSGSRPFREFDLLASLFKLGLPVPRPVAALCEHSGIISTGAIMTARLEGVKTLVEAWSEASIGADLWAEVGKCIRRFHDAGVWHADLNARNILLNEEGKVYLIDFDRARFRAGKKVDGRGNLKRLKRSLVKLWPESQSSELQPAWSELKAGYDG